MDPMQKGNGQVLTNQCGVTRVGARARGQPYGAKEVLCPATTQLSPVPTRTGKGQCGVVMTKRLMRSVPVIGVAGEVTVK